MSLDAAPTSTVDPPRLVDLVEVDAIAALAAETRLVVVDGRAEPIAGVVSGDEERSSARAALLGGAVQEGGPFAALSLIRLREHRIGAVLARQPADASSAAALARIVEGWAHARFEVQSVVGELVWRYEELSVLYDSSETIASVMDLAEVARRILAKAVDMLDVDHASLMLIDNETRELRILDAVGLAPEIMESLRLPVGEEISGWVAAEGKPLLIEDIESHVLFGKVNQERYINRSLLSVPLKIKDRVIGVLNVNNKRNRAVFSSSDLKLLSSLASLAAISIENANTYKNAITDRLTQLYNYGYFREELARKVQLARSEQAPLSLLMFDIDHFKNFNDRNGHELANVALVRIANLCLENSRQKGDRIPDLVARYGGEEFMILLYGVDTEGARVTAERVRESVATTVFKGGENQPGGRVTISMGVATFPQHAADGDSLINGADEALYKAKKGGRNQVQVAEIL